MKNKKIKIKKQRKSPNLREPAEGLHYWAPPHLHSPNRQDVKPITFSIASDIVGSRGGYSVTKRPLVKGPRTDGAERGGDFRKLKSSNPM
jgi:hypothetical protein